ncbi:hypothetical protein SKAU_G00366690 [Synaphobranchus kaupii]|uniref:Ig-like domain-containing protein n=1 Tax=Synaphobranchus kaupii TaxID=118154 RepID=A0A9Q1EF76_SYNKA|nr:hypothetical protein SKAU_G00366690 [Synaphobranchus kaupii]
MAQTYTCGLMLYSISVITTVLLSQVPSWEVHPGDNVLLPCSFLPGSVGGYLSWFWLGPNESGPLTILSVYDDTKAEVSYHNHFTQDHIKLHRTNSTCELINVDLSDSGLYVCGKMPQDYLIFDKATLVEVEGLRLHTAKPDIEGSEPQSRTVVLQQPESESVQPGDSVTLQCTVHTETCAGEHSVYWFRQGSGESPPGIIYTHGNRSDECQRSSGAVSPTQSCVYNFPKRNLSLSDAGTYYCAVATCGEILFGNGTKLDIEGIVTILAWLSILRTGVIVCTVTMCVIFCHFRRTS